MKKAFRKINATVPCEYREAFSREIDKENLFRLIIMTALLLLTETSIILFLKDNVLNTGEVVFNFIVYILFSLPVIYIVYRKADQLNASFIKTVQLGHLICILFFCLALALFPQSEFVSIHVYILAIFAIAAFIYLFPLESALLFFSVYLIFYFMLPRYQNNPDILVILRVNALIMNVAAWILSRMVIGMRILSFIDKKVIIRKNQQLRNMAKRDSMTLLLNHETVYMSLCEEIARAKFTNYPLTVIMIDIDDFKQVNDSHGHLCGDKVIVQVAQVLTQTCRATDIIGRYGGEEFIIIMPETSLNEAMFLAERLRSTIEKTQFETGCNITVSGGVMEYNGETAEELIMGADESHYKAKNSGKNKVIICNKTKLREQ